MQLVSSGTATAQDIAAAYVVVATIPKPVYGGAMYALEIGLTGLDAGQTIVVKDDRGGSDVYLSEEIASGQTATVIRLERENSTAGAAMAISIKDTGGGSTAAAWKWKLYRLDDEAMPQPCYPVPKNATQIPLVFRMNGTGVTPIPTVQLSKNGSAYANAAGAVAPVGQGWFKLTPTADDTSTTGSLTIRAVATGSNGAQEIQYATYLVYDDASSDIAAAVDAELQDDFAGLANAGNNVAGAGSVSYTVQIKETEDADPIDGASVWVTNDEAGTDIEAGTAFSNTNGNVTFLLDPGSYYLWATIGGRKHVSARAFTVEA